MKTKTQILSLGREALVKYKKEINALRRKSKTRPQGKITADFPLVVYTIAGADKLRFTITGICSLLFEDDKPIGTVHFSRRKKSFAFSHFSFQKKSSQALLHTINYAIRKFKIPSDQVLDLIWVTPFNPIAIRYKDNQKFKFLQFNDTRNYQLVEKAELFEKHKALVSEVVQAQKEYIQLKEESNEIRINRLRELNYL